MEKRICVFVDFLGWKNKIKEISDIKDAQAKLNQSDKIRNLLTECFSQIDGGQSKEAQLKFNTDHEENNSDFAQALKEYHDKIDLQFTMVSDCVVISMRYPTDNEGYKACLLMFWMLMNTQRLMLSNKILIKGGIACGDLLHKHEKTYTGSPVNFVFGQAQIEAVQLEKEEKYPRVIFYDDNLYNDLKQYIKKPLQGDSQSIKTFNYIKKDTFTIKEERVIEERTYKVGDKKECYFLDYTDPNYLQEGFERFDISYKTLSANDDLDMYHKPILDFLNDEIIKHDEKIGCKYKWVLERLNNNLPEVKKGLEDFANKHQQALNRKFYEDDK